MTPQRLCFFVLLLVIGSTILGGLKFSPKKGIEDQILFQISDELPAGELSVVGGAS